MCVNQSHHILRLARQWKMQGARWTLFQVLDLSRKSRQNYGMGGQSTLFRETMVIVPTGSIQGNMIRYMCNMVDFVVDGDISLSLLGGMARKLLIHYKMPKKSVFTAPDLCQISYIIHPRMSSQTILSRGLQKKARPPLQLGLT